MDDVPVRLEHVDLLNRLDWLNVELLEGCLQLLVVHACALMHLLDLSSRCALPTIQCQQFQTLCTPLYLITESLIAFFDSANGLEKEGATYPIEKC